MKNLYYFLFLVLFSASVKAQIVNIPDANFKNKLLNYQPVIDINSDGEIQVSEALVVTILNIPQNPVPGINNLTGLEKFVNLNELDCSGVPSLFSSFDKSVFTVLKKVTCTGFGSGVTSLNFSDLTSLEYLNCSYNNDLSTLIVTGAINLKTLVCGECNLSSIDLTNQVNLTSLQISGQFSSINLQSNTNLETLSIVANLSSINLNPLVNLKYLRVYNGTLESLEVSSLVNLETLEISYTSLTSLNLNSISLLKKIKCSNNNIVSLNVNTHTNLIELDCSDNQIVSVDVSNLVNLTNFNCSSNYLSSINLTNNINLVKFNCNGNEFDVLDVTNLINLKEIDCAANNINLLDVSNLVNLTIFNCSNNNLSNINVSNLNNLIDFNCSVNLLNTLNISNLINLKNLTCFNNLLTSIDVSNLINLESLGCGNNQITTLDLQNQTRLYGLSCPNTLISSLDLSKFNNPNQGGRCSLDINDNPNLIYVNLKNGTGFFYYSIEYFGLNNPNLVFVCANESEVQMVQSLVYPITQVNSYCTFVPGGINNLITGTISLDANNNSCDNSDLPAMSTKINMNDGVVSSAIFTNHLGKYSFFTQTGSFVIAPVFENPYFIISPTTATLNFPTLNGMTQTQNFCITPNGVHNDVEIAIIPIQGARPGFDANYQLVYKNKGNQTLSGNINLAFDDAVLDFVSANPAITNQSLNTLNWSYSNLLPFESRTIDFTLNVNSPMETPAVNIGDVLHFTASIDPVSGDETTIDNTFTFAQTVIGSFDPNDKTCLEGNTITPEKVGDYLHYIIHFQNSGTAAAENIVVKDVIDTTKFDISSLQLTSASHPYETKVTGDKIEFIFENIQLPAEIDNEPASQGFVAFKIKTKSDLVLGNSVSNKADIYFDYNFPIVTEPAVTTVSVLGVNEFENKSVSVFPNPVTDVLNITSKGIIKSVQIYDVQGRLTDTFLKDEEKTTINLSNKKTGDYFVKIFTDKGVKVEKVVKK